VQRALTDRLPQLIQMVSTGERSMSLRLSAALGSSPEFWLKMQMQYDLWQARKTKQPKIRPFPHATKRKELALV
jgi:plasmid maintenance system antidote protein VapI